MADQQIDMIFRTMVSYSGGRANSSVINRSSSHINGPDGDLNQPPRQISYDIAISNEHELSLVESKFRADIVSDSKSRIYNWRDSEKDISIIKDDVARTLIKNPLNISVTSYRLPKSAQITEAEYSGSDTDDELSKVDGFNELKQAIINNQGGHISSSFWKKLAS